MQLTKYAVEVCDAIWLSGGGSGSAMIGGSAVLLVDLLTPVFVCGELLGG